ncbi:MAG: cytochrome c3 family protein [Desulfocapsa sp.]|nr:cytochrome c3 family protein [Desulfocapsa sp.]
MVTGETGKRLWQMALPVSVSALCLFGLLCCKGATTTHYDGEGATAKPTAKKVSAPVAMEEETGLLSNRDCVKCHSQVTSVIAAKGESHKTEVTCQDCHDGHPPEIKEVIPKCSQCHSGASHYELKGCLTCHSNPHTPLSISLADNLTAPCLTCHEEQKPQLVEFVSAHSDLDCTNCHQEKHGMVPSCLDCHDEGHSPEMVQADCSNCHQAHKPLAVGYNDDLASKQCASCHTVAFDLLMASTTKHHDVSCATCHKKEHKMVPKCQDCHGEPHPASITAKFPTCGSCHNIAHDLNK